MNQNTEEDEMTQRLQESLTINNIEIQPRSLDSFSSSQLELGQNAEEDEMTQRLQESLAFNDIQIQPRSLDSFSSSPSQQCNARRSARSSSLDTSSQKKSVTVNANNTRPNDTLVSRISSETFAIEDHYDDVTKSVKTDPSKILDISSIEEQDRLLRLLGILSPLKPLLSTQYGYFQFSEDGILEEVYGALVTILSVFEEDLTPNPNRITWSKSKKIQLYENELDEFNKCLLDSNSRNNLSSLLWHGKRWKMMEMQSHTMSNIIHKNGQMYSMDDAQAITNQVRATIEIAIVCGLFKKNTYVINTKCGPGQNQFSLLETIQVDSMDRLPTMFCCQLRGGGNPPVSYVNLTYDVKCCVVYETKKKNKRRTRNSETYTLARMHSLPMLTRLLNEGEDIRKWHGEHLSHISTDMSENYVLSVASINIGRSGCPGGDGCQHGCLEWGKSCIRPGPTAFGVGPLYVAQDALLSHNKHFLQLNPGYVEDLKKFLKDSIAQPSHNNYVKIQLQRQLDELNPDWISKFQKFKGFTKNMRNRPHY